mmetsp:Transcript_34065/g.75082  ORF Transcript_34065/g.75082 Transcript_34065/m.75082 type:complete len:333 (+) Transcript_34065:2990-3988(+)
MTERQQKLTRLPIMCLRKRPSFRSNSCRIPAGPAWASTLPSLAESMKQLTAPCSSIQCPTTFEMSTLSSALPSEPPSSPAPSSLSLGTYRSRMILFSISTFFRYVFWGCSATMSPTLPGGRNLLAGTSTTLLKNTRQPPPPSPNFLGSVCECERRVTRGAADPCRARSQMKSSSSLQAPCRHSSRICASTSTGTRYRSASLKSSPGSEFESLSAASMSSESTSISLLSESSESDKLEGAVTSALLANQLSPPPPKPALGGTPRSRKASIPVRNLSFLARILARRRLGVGRWKILVKPSLRRGGLCAPQFSQPFTASAALWKASITPACRDRV